VRTYSDVAAASADGEWRRSASCAQSDPDAFFPQKGESFMLALRVCQTCPVRPECLIEAMANRERYGFWGGLASRARATLAAQGEDAVRAKVVTMAANVDLGAPESVTVATIGYLGDADDDDLDDEVAA
jgi:WhiB family redox-sensing transcriptional regulator